MFGWGGCMVGGASPSPPDCGVLQGSADRPDSAGAAPPPADHPSQPPPPAAACCRPTSPPASRCRRLTLDEKFALCRSVGEECVQEEELRRLLEKKPNPVAYDGFEPSGRMHIAQARSACLRGAV